MANGRRRNTLSHPPGPAASGGGSRGMEQHYCFVLADKLLHPWHKAMGVERRIEVNLASWSFEAIPPEQLSKRFNILFRDSFDDQTRYRL